MASFIGSRTAWAAFKHKHKSKRKQQTLTCYVERKGSLQEIGYANYHEYLQSEEWRRVRKETLESRSGCALCTKKADQVHHLSYDTRTLLGQKPYHLVSLCGECHKWIEYDGERKLTVDQANKRLMQLARLTDSGIAWMNEYRKERASWRHKDREPQNVLCIKCRLRPPKKGKKGWSICKECSRRDGGKRTTERKP